MVYHYGKCIIPFILIQGEYFLSMNLNGVVIRDFYMGKLSGKISCFLAQTVSCSELVGSTKLSVHDTCHFAGFFSQLPRAFHF